MCNYFMQMYQKNITLTSHLRRKEAFWGTKKPPVKGGDVCTKSNCIISFHPCYSYNPSVSYADSSPCTGAPFFYIIKAFAIKKPPVKGGDVWTKSNCIIRFHPRYSYNPSVSYADSSPCTRRHSSISSKLLQ